MYVCSPDDDEIKSNDGSLLLPLLGGTLREVQAPLSPVSASAEPDILSLQSQFLLDGDAGVEMNRIGSSSRTTAGHRSQTTPTPTMAASELQKNTVSHDVTMLDPSSKPDVSSLSSLLDIDGEDEDVPLLVPEQQSGCRKTDSVGGDNDGKIILYSGC